MPGSELFFGLPGYVSAGSLRFNAADNPNVVYKPLTTGNRKLWTWSAWIKRCKCSTVQYVFEVASADSNTNRIFFRFAATGEFRVAEATTVRLETTRAFRDPGAWYHFLVKVDTANSTPDNRCQIYVNGELETLVFEYSTTYIAQNADLFVMPSLLEGMPIVLLEILFEYKIFIVKYADKIARINIYK